MAGDPLHDFDAALALARQDDGCFAGHTHPAWANMVGPFGGISTAQALQALMLHPARLGEPVALTVNFAAALADGPFTVQARPLRTNRSTQHWLVEMTQDGALVLSGTAVTAVRRPTFATTEHAMPEVPQAHDIAAPQGQARVAWVRQYDMRFVEGGYPPAWDGCDHGHSRTRLWMRHQPPRPLDYPGLAAMADIFFPRVWRRRASLVPLGTVSMTVYFHADAGMLQRVGPGWLLGQAQGQAFRDGYFDHSGQLWSEAGELLATTHQIVYFKH